MPSLPNTEKGNQMDTKTRVCYFQMPKINPIIADKYVS